MYGDSINVADGRLEPRVSRSIPLLRDTGVSAVMNVAVATSPTLFVFHHIVLDPPTNRTGTFAVATRQLHVVARLTFGHFPPMRGKAWC